MTYELAKELKEAGFVQIRPGLKEPNPFSLIYPKDQTWFEGWPMRPAPEDSPNAINIDDTELKLLVGAYAPTLSELIEACGEVSVFCGKGYASATNREMQTNNEVCGGSTPEEAVARLWLALNKRP